MLKYFTKKVMFLDIKIFPYVRDSFKPAFKPKCSHISSF